MSFPLHKTTSGCYHLETHSLRTWDNAKTACENVASNVILAELGTEEVSIFIGPHAHTKNGSLSFFSSHCCLCFAPTVLANWYVLDITREEFDISSRACRARELISSSSREISIISNALFFSINTCQLSPLRSVKCIILWYQVTELVELYVF